MQYFEIIRILKANANPKNVEGMAKFGINSQNTLGISIPFLRTLAKQIGKSHYLATELWKSRIHEARILACYIDDYHEVTQTQMDNWVNDFDSWDICDQVCGNLFDKTPFAYKKAKEWIKKESEFTRRAGFVMFAELSVHDKNAKDEVFLDIFPLIKEYATDNRNFVKKAVNWSLRQIGKRNFALKNEAILLAEDLIKMNSKSARWIGSNALRELKQSEKNLNQYICTNCSYETSIWQGECPSCHQWNTLVENNFQKVSTTKIKPSKVTMSKLDDIKLHSEPVVKIGMPLVENVLGGGIHESQIILIAGEPGIGKSTLLLQIVKNFPKKAAYISGEESLSQIAKRAERLKGGKNFDNVEFVSSTTLDTVLSLIASKEFPLIIVDSIQTLIDTENPGFAGSANQVRICTFKITETAKQNNIAVILVGQITKEGEIAGPKMMEHLVDTVLYFEGERKSDLRILKSYKNRFGAVGESAIFEMEETGLKEIIDVGRYFLRDMENNSEGVAYSVVSDGSIIYAVEIQALVNKSFFPIPKRLATNYDNNRLQMLTAVLQKKLNLGLYESDIYVNVAGGIKVSDTSADLAVCAAIISSFKNKRISTNAFIGEVGLTGSVQKTSRNQAKISQAQKLGFKKIYNPENISNIKDLLKEI